MNEVLGPVDNNGHVGRTYEYWNALEVNDKEYCKESSVKTAPGAITTIPLQDFTIRK